MQIFEVYWMSHILLISKKTHWLVKIGKSDLLKISGKFVAPQLGVIIPFNVFLYEENDKIVFTDIDGTITQSDIKVRILKEF